MLTILKLGKKFKDEVSSNTDIDLIKREEKNMYI